MDDLEKNVLFARNKDIIFTKPCDKLWSHKIVKHTQTIQVRNLDEEKHLNVNHGIIVGNLLLQPYHIVA